MYAPALFVALSLPVFGCGSGTGSNDADGGRAGATGAGGNIGVGGHSGSGGGSAGAPGSAGSTGGGAGSGGNDGSAGGGGNAGSVGGNTGNAGSSGSGGSAGLGGHAGSAGGIGNAGAGGHAGSTGGSAGTGNAGAGGHAGSTGGSAGTGSAGAGGHAGSTGGSAGTGSAGAGGHAGSTGGGAGAGCSVCPGRQTCQGKGAQATCQCPGAPAGCSAGAGQVCIGNDLQTCAVDPNGCVYQSARKTCPSGDSCTGAFPDGDCVCPAAPAICSGQVGTFCDQSGAVVVTCALDADGCLVKSTQATCPTVPCSGSGGAAKCGSCAAPPAECQNAGTLCPSTTQVEKCGFDTNGCLSKLSVQSCAAGLTCKGALPSGACVCPALPNWWTGTSPYNDPLWTGAYGYSSGTVSFNAWTDSESTGNALLLRWHVTGDAGAALLGDQVWVGFYNPAGTGTGTILQFTRDALTNTTAGAVGAGVMSAAAFTRVGSAAFWSSTPVPSAIDADARLDAFCDTSSAPVICDEWIIRLRVPMSAVNGGLDLGTPFEMWFEVDVEHGNTGTTDAISWPTGAIDVDETTAPVTFPPPLGAVTPASTAWYGVSAGGGACGSNFVP